MSQQEELTSAEKMSEFIPRSLGRSDKVSDRAAKAILADIRMAGLKPGDVLPPEARMLERYGAGRASLREALRILEVNGIIRVKAGPGGGPVVADTSAVDFGRTASLHFNVHDATLRDFMDARCVIEPVLAALTAEKITQEEAELLRALHEAESEPQRDSSGQWMKAAGDFHVVVANLSGNKVLSLYSNSLSSILREHLGQSLVPQSERLVAAKAHDRIAQAIIAGRADEAAGLMTKHLDALRGHLERFGSGVLDQPISWI